MTSAARRHDVATWLDRNAAERGDDVAVADGGRSVTHAQLRSLVAGCARSLNEAVPVGAVVALSADASVDGIVALLGGIVSTAVVAPLNTRLTLDELDRYLDRVAPHTIVSDSSHPAASLNRPVNDLDQLVSNAAHPSTLLADPGDATDPGATPAIVFPTGGTTGLPKAAAWGRLGLALAIASSVDNLVVGPTDVELYISPLFHVTVVPGFLATLAAGGRVVVQPRFDAAAAAELIERGQVTRMFGTPTAVGRILDRLDGPQAGNQMRLIYGAARSSEAFRARLRAALPDALVYSGYGATEVGAVVRLKPEHGDGDGGVGHPVDGVTIRIIDAGGADQATGDRGDVAIRSPFTCLGYLGSDVDGPRRLGDGSVVTGDVGWLDDDGFLHLDGRRTEMIKTGGENVFPAEVEAVLLAHPRVEDAAVIGVDDPDWGEAVRAVVVVCQGEATDASELIAHCRRSLAGYKVPKAISFVDALPMTASLKIDRAALAVMVASC